MFGPITGDCVLIHITKYTVLRLKTDTFRLQSQQTSSSFVTDSLTVATETQIELQHYFGNVNLTYPDGTVPNFAGYANVRWNWDGVYDADDGAGPNDFGFADAFGARVSIRRLETENSGTTCVLQEITHEDTFRHMNIDDGYWGRTFDRILGDPSTCGVSRGVNQVAPDGGFVSFTCVLHFPNPGTLFTALYGVQSESTDPTPSDPFPIPHTRGPKD
jgi:hypothetical protein